MTLEEIALRYPGGRFTRPDHYETHCLTPAHARGDRRPSLGFTRAADGRILVCCQLGCSAADVLAAGGLTFADLAPVNGQQGREETVYTYHDDRGEPVCEKVRLPGKQFFFRLPGAAKGGLNGLEPPLYRLPDLLATRPGDTCGVCEGEKDADNLARHGLPATCNPHGAALPGQRPKWKPEYTRWLAEHLPDRRFVVFADQDEAGLAHAEAVIAALAGAGLSVRAAPLAGLKPGEDVSDWLGRHTPEEFAALLEPTPHPLFQKLLTRDQLRALPAPAWQVQGLFLENATVELYGESSHGKSLVAMDIALSLVRGGAWAGCPILKAGPVVYVNADGGRGFSARLRAWEQVNGTAHSFEFWTYPAELLLADPTEMRWFTEGIESMEEAPVMIVFDTLSQCIPGVNENQQEQMSLVIAHLNMLKRVSGCSPWLVHHVGKDGMNRGSTVIPGAADTILRIQAKPAGLIELVCEKQRDGRKFEPLYFEVVPHGVDEGVYLVQAGAKATVAARRDERCQRVLDVLQVNGGWLSRQEVRERLVGVSAASVARYLDDLVAENAVIETEQEQARGAPRKVYLFRPDSSQ